MSKKTTKKKQHLVVPANHCTLELTVEMREYDSKSNLLNKESACRHCLGKGISKKVKTKKTSNKSHMVVTAESTLYDGDGNVKAQYKIELYPVTEAQFKAKSIVGASTKGATVTNEYDGSKFNYTFNDINGYTISYGRYAVKLSINVEGAANEIEDCYQLRFLTVPVLVGQDNSKPNSYVTADDVRITEKALVTPTTALAKFANETICCEDPFLELLQNGGYPRPSGIAQTSCDWMFIVHYDCTNEDRLQDLVQLVLTLQYDDPVTGWTDVPEFASEL